MPGEEQKPKKAVTIYVNAQAHEWAKEPITYAEVVTLGFPEYPQHPEITYSVKYKRGLGQKPEGSLAPGEAVTVKEEMTFRVTPTGQS